MDYFQPVFFFFFISAICLTYITWLTMTIGVEFLVGFNHPTHLIIVDFSGLDPCITLQEHDLS